MALAASNKSHTVEPFTQMPNRYLDYIAPKLSSTERDVAEVIIRYTKGYHVASAQIPNRVFMTRTGKSEPTIIKAKKSLIDLGLLVVLNDGGGTITTEYMIDLYYNNPNKSIKAQLARQDEQVAELSAQHTLDVISTESDAITDTTAKPIELDSQKVDTTDAIIAEPDVEVPDMEPEVAHPSSTATHDVPSTTEAIAVEPDAGVPDVEPGVDHLSSSAAIDTNTTDAPTMEVGATSSTISTISDAHVPTESIVADSNAIPTTKVSSVLPYKDLDLSIININKIHTEATNHEVTPEAKEVTSTRQQAATVRYHFKSLFPDAINKGDWPLFGWAVSTYGAEVCLDKLKLLGEYRKTSKIDNPKGLFRTALTKDYQPNKWVQTKLRTEESARRARKRTRKEADEKQAMIQGYNYEVATAALQKLMETLN